MIKVTRGDPISGPLMVEWSISKRGKCWDALVGGLHHRAFTWRQDWKTEQEKKPKECISSSEVSVETGTNQHGIPGKQISGSVSVVCCSEPPGVSQTRLPPGDQTAVAESESKSVCFCKLPLSCRSLNGVNGVRSLQSTENISILLSEAHF